MKHKLLPNTCINFHDIHDQKWFENIIRLLKRMYTMVSLEDIYAFYYDDMPLKNVCHITFDDGDRSFYEKAFPILKKYDVPVSIYVSPKATIEQQNFWFQEIRGYDEDILLEIMDELELFEKDKLIPHIKPTFKKLSLYDIWKVINMYQAKTGTSNKPCYNMDTDQIIELDQSGLVSVGAHTLSHPILKNESDERASYEIQGSVNKLSEILNREVIHFAYPNGRYGEDFDEREMGFLDETGIKLSFTTDKGQVSAVNHTLKIPRNGLTKGGSFNVFTKLFMGKKWDDMKSVIGSKKNKLG